MHTAEQKNLPIPSAAGTSKPRARVTFNVRTGPEEAHENSESKLLSLETEISRLRGANENVMASDSLKFIPCYVTNIRNERVSELTIQQFYPLVEHYLTWRFYVGTLEPEDMQILAPLAKTAASLLSVLVAKF
jgi:hypothetical protein